MQNDKKFPPAETGNASNPSTDNETKPLGQQLIDERGEKYLREISSIEDLPDDEDQQDMEHTIEKENQ